MGGRGVRVNADTNLLLRATVQDDPAQARVAEVLLSQATVVAAPAPVLCEFTWVLKRRPPPGSTRFDGPTSRSSR